MSITYTILDKPRASGKTTLIKLKIIEDYMSLTASRDPKPIDDVIVFCINDNNTLYKYTQRLNLIKNLSFSKAELRKLASASTVTKNKYINVYIDDAFSLDSKEESEIMFLCERLAETNVVKVFGIGTLKKSLHGLRKYIKE